LDKKSSADLRQEGCQRLAGQLSVLSARIAVRAGMALAKHEQSPLDLVIGWLYERLVPETMGIGANASLAILPFLAALFALEVACDRGYRVGAGRCGHAKVGRYVRTRC
jgi:hypothetical protein